ncbi:hypothetical protein [Nocardia sp. CA-135398]|uniref:hypothetical protein n=1 Tax=Nocardia sp. CA-135398 TaxID=3239977 RepID=UPI003D97F1FB
MKFATALPAYEELRTGILGMPDYPDPTAPPPVTDAAGTAEPTPETETTAEPEWVEAAPEVAAAELIALVNMPNPPVRKVIGPGAHQMVAMALDQRRRDYLSGPEFIWPA